MYWYCNSQIQQEGGSQLVDVRVSFMPLVDREGFFTMMIGRRDVLGVVGDFKANTRYGLFRGVPNILQAREFISTPTVSIPLSSPTIEVIARLGVVGPQSFEVPTTKVEENGEIKVLEAIQVRFDGSQFIMAKKYKTV